MLRLLAMGLIVSCGQSDQSAHVSADEANLDTMNVVQQKVEPRTLATKTIEKRFIYAPSGLNLRNGPSTSDEKIETISYGSEIELLDCPGKAILTIDGLKGKMCKVRYDGKEGFIFTGYLSRFPAPKPELDVKGFIQLMQNKGLQPEYKKERFDDGGYIQDTEGFQLPIDDWQEAFLIAKIYFGIPDKISYPSDQPGTQVVVENPDKNEYIWNDELVVNRQEDGKTIKEIFYYYRGEGGGRTISIEKSETGGLNVLETLIAD
ncbi:MAG: SH3 domain-containing protein [Bacteroidota bacterium]